MTQPKYKIGDKVWMMKDNELREMIVCGVYVSRFACTYDKDDYVFYLIAPSDSSGINSPWVKFVKRGAAKWFARGRSGMDEFIVDSYLENDLFPSKQSLIESL